MKQNTYVCIDLETTGLNPKRDKIIEIGAVKIVDGFEAGRFSTFVNPGVKLENRVTELTGIADRDLENAPYIEDIFSKLLDFIEDHIFLGHRVLFDYSFLKRYAVNNKINFEKKGIDTLKLARKYLTELEHKNLEYLCQYFNIQHRAHRALDDALATVKLYEILMDKYFNEEDKLFQGTLLSFNVKRDTPATKAQKERLLRLIKERGLVVNYDVDKLTRSEASRYTDKILSLGKLENNNI